jgi:tRNA threonylcarbamoyladenosine biosynthesis protein TsaB
MMPNPSRLRLIALDCAAGACSVAAYDSVALLEAGEGTSRQSAQLVLGLVSRVLAQVGWAPGDVAGIAVSAGPGSFTGVRLGLSVAQGLAMAWRCPVLPVSTLAALALTVEGHQGQVLALLDARMGELYSGWFDRKPDGGVTALSQEIVSDPETLGRIGDHTGPFVVVGSVWQMYGGRLQERLGTPIRIDERNAPGATAVATLAAHSGQRIALDPVAIEPAYLRDRVALTRAERARIVGAD